MLTGQDQLLHNYIGNETKTGCPIGLSVQNLKFKKIKTEHTAASK